MTEVVLNVTVALVTVGGLLLVALKLLRLEQQRLDHLNRPRVTCSRCGHTVDGEELAWQPCAMSVMAGVEHCDGTYRVPLSMWVLR